MQEYYHKDLDRAINLTLKDRDYGQAMYIALRTFMATRSLDPDPDLVEKSRRFIHILERMIELDFEAQARIEGIKFTPENKTQLMRQYSPHWQKFDSYLRPGGMQRYDFRYITPLTFSPN